MPPHKSSPTCGNHETFELLGSNEDAILRVDDAVLYLDEKERNDVQNQNRERIRKIVHKCWRHFGSAPAQKRLYENAVRVLLKKMVLLVDAPNNSRQPAFLPKKVDPSGLLDVSLGPICQTVWDEFLCHRIHNFDLNFDLNDLAESDYDSE